MSDRRPPASELLRTPGALLTTSDLRALGLQRGAIESVFRALDNVHFPGYSRPMIRAEDYLAFVAEHTFGEDRVR